MRWKLLTLLPVLVLMVFTVTPFKVKAQGLVEYALILVLIPVGTGETGEIIWERPNPGNSQEPVPPLLNQQTFTIVVTNTGDSSCPSDVVTTTVDSRPGLNSLTLGRKPTKLIINGEEQDIEECLGDDHRVAYQVGVPWIRGFTNEGGAAPMARGFELKNVQIKSYAIHGSDEANTRAVTVVNNHLKSKGTPPSPSREVVVGVGATQSLNLYYPVPSNNSDIVEPLERSFSISLEPVPNPSGSAAGCTQSFEAPVNGVPGLQTLTLGIGSVGGVKKLLINGVMQEPPLDGYCFDEAKRVVMIVGDLNAYTQEDPITSTSPRKNASIVMYDITDSNGATAASSSWVGQGWDLSVGAVVVD